MKAEVVMGERVVSLSLPPASLVCFQTISPSVLGLFRGRRRSGAKLLLAKPFLL